MKTFKFLVALTVVMGFGMSAMAQNTANDKISAKAQVFQSVTVADQVDLDFGYVAQGANKSIGLTNNVTGLPNQGTQTTGRFLVSAAAATSVDLTFTVPSNLLKEAVTLAIDTYKCGWAKDNAYTVDPISFGADETITTDIASFPTNVVETVNGVYVFIGATVKPTVSQAIGNYAADITLTATYN